MARVGLHWIPVALEIESPPKKSMFGTNTIRTLVEDVWFLRGIMNDWLNVFYLSDSTFSTSRGTSFIKHFYSSPVNIEGSELFISCTYLTGD